MLMRNQGRNDVCHPTPRPNGAAPADALVAAAPLHRIAEVRRRQDVSMRAVRQALALTNEEVRQQENENYDMLLSQLYRWQRLLDVPVCELLSEPRLQLSQPVFARAALIKAMKTASTILQAARQPGLQTLAQRLIDQLLEVMPELAGVAPWPTVGQRRTLTEYGRIAEQPMSLAPPDE